MTRHHENYGTQGKDNAHDIRGNVDKVTWGQRIGPREKVKIGGPRTYKCNMMPLLERHFHVTLIELVAFQIAIVVSCCEAHLVGFAALDEGSGTDSSNMVVVKGDDALGGAAGEVG
jgi:hypothetical protein